MLDQTDCWINSQSVLCDDRPDISEGLASVYLKFKRPLNCLQPSTPAQQNGLRVNDPKPAGKWIERFEEWLADGGFLKKL
jgi:hypothetical protein